MIHITCQPIHKLNAKKFAERIYEQAARSMAHSSARHTEQEKWNVCARCALWCKCVCVCVCATNGGGKRKWDSWSLVAGERTNRLFICTKNILRLISVSSLSLFPYFVSICMLFVVHKFDSVSFSPSVWEILISFFRSSIIFDSNALCRIGHSTYWYVSDMHMHDACILFAYVPSNGVAMPHQTR